MTAANSICFRMWQRTLPKGFMARRASPSKPTKPRSGSQWHEIEHDGFRIIARESGAQVRPYNRPGIGQLVIGAVPYRKDAVTSPGRMFLQPAGRRAYPIPAD